MRNFTSIFIGLLGIFISCGDSSSSTGCGTDFFSNEYSVGSIDLDSVTNHWMLPKNMSSLLFKNSNGGEFRFDVKNFGPFNKRYNLFLNQKVTGPCVRKDYVYVNSTYKSSQIGSIDVPFMINIEQLKNIDERRFTDTLDLSLAKIKRISDRIKVRIGYSEAFFKIPDSSSYLIPSLQLVDSIYSNVYAVPTELNMGLDYVYFQRDYGILGFKFSTNEIWVRK
jgi:hypothetical protein